MWIKDDSRGMDTAMEVRWDAETGMKRGKKASKRRRSNGAVAAEPSGIAAQTGRLLADRARDWLDRLAAEPACFAAVEREVHEQQRRQADAFVAGLLAQVSEQPSMVDHVAKTMAAAEAPLRPVEKKDGG